MALTAGEPGLILATLRPTKQDECDVLATPSSYILTSPATGAVDQKRSIEEVTPRLL